MKKPFKDPEKIGNIEPIKSLAEMDIGKILGFRNLHLPAKGLCNLDQTLDVPVVAAIHIELKDKQPQEIISTDICKFCPWFECSFSPPS